MAKKILDFKEDEAKSNDYVLVTNDTDGTRKVSVPNLNFKYVQFSGTTDENGFVPTELSVNKNHPISIFVPNALSSFYPDMDKGVFTVRVCGFDGKPSVGNNVTGTLYYVSD